MNDDQKIIWTERGAKDLFRCKFWPSFVGAKNVNKARNGQDEAGSYPIILWKEQRIEYQKNLETNSKKRKIEEVDANRKDETTKRFKTEMSIFNEVYNFFSSVLKFNFLSNLFGSVPTNTSNDISTSVSEVSTLEKNESQKLVYESPDTFRCYIFSSLHTSNYFVGPGDIYGKYFQISC